MFQRQTQALRPLTSAHLAQTMHLMGLTTLELKQKIEAELACNPALELLEDRMCPTCHRRLPSHGPCPVCSTPKGPESDEPVVFVSPREEFFTPDRLSPSNQIEDEPEDLAPEIEDLPAFVLRQIAADLAPEDRPLAAHLLTNLDSDGLLAVSVLEVARYHHVPLSRASQVLAQIQRADPIGVGSPTPQEALLVQLKVLGERFGAGERFARAERAILEGFDLLSRHNYTELGRLLGGSLAEARETAQFIADNLNPFPARAHWGDARRQVAAAPTAYTQVYHHPDIIVSQLENNPVGRLVVEIALPIPGVLQVNPLFRAALQQAPPEKTEAWKNDLERASLLVKCIQQRNHTLVRLMQRLATCQREFILHGPACLRPLTRAQLALELDLHESTISRAVSEKTLQLPNRRIIPLAMFFDSSLPVRTALREIIEAETCPLTDTQLVRHLQTRGYRVARRTVAKYRMMEGILPSHLRNMGEPS